MAIKQLKIEKSITLRESKSFEKYLSDFSKIPLISSEQASILAKRIKDGDALALQELVKANLRFVISVAKQYQNKGMNLEDLVNEGNLGLIKAAERFDETRGFKFISFAVWWVRQSIMQFLADNSRMIRLPLNKIALLSKHNRTMSELEQKLERTPDILEICDVMGINTTASNKVELETTSEKYKRIHKALGGSDNIVVCLKRVISMDARVSEDENSQPMSDFLSDDNVNETDGGLITESLTIDIVRCLSKLTNRESAVVKSYFGIGCPSLNLEEIAEELELTRERVRQIKETAIRKLKAKTSLNILKKYIL